MTKERFDEIIHLTEDNHDGGDCIASETEAELWSAIEQGNRDAEKVECFERLFAKWRSDERARAERLETIVAAVKDFLLTPRNLAEGTLATINSLGVFIRRAEEAKP